MDRIRARHLLMRYERSPRPIDSSTAQVVPIVSENGRDALRVAPRTPPDGATAGAARSAVPKLVTGTHTNGTAANSAFQHATPAITARLVVVLDVSFSIDGRTSP